MSLIRKLTISRIYCDPGFNCRGSFDIQSIRELAESIKAVGLLMPVVVQPRRDVDIPSKYNFRLIAGFRRLAATKLLKETKIEAVVRPGLSDSDARKVNLQENLARENLTPGQELDAILRIYGDNPNAKQVSKDLGRSLHWVKTRLKIRDLPVAARDALAKGKLTAWDLSLLVRSPKEEQESLVAQLLAAHASKVSTTEVAKRIGKNRRSRNRGEIHQMISTLMDLEVEPDPWKSLAWASGTLTTEDFLNDPT